MANFPETIPALADMEVTIDAKDFKYNKIVFFAADSMSVLDAANNNINTAEKAYNNYMNSGVAVKKNNKFVIRLRSPQPYLSDGIMYQRHLHFFPCDFPTKLYTKSCVPDHETVKPIFNTQKCVDIPSMFLCFERALMCKHEGVLCVNALKEEDGNVFKNDFHIHYELSTKLIEEKLKLIPKHKPILVYCYKVECNAASKLMKKLVDLGYNNLFYFPGGVLEKNEKIKFLI
jgi:rhodanese-related sulfurtransferase